MDGSSPGMKNNIVTHNFLICCSSLQDAPPSGPDHSDERWSFPITDQSISQEYVITDQVQ